MTSGDRQDQPRGTEGRPRRQAEPSRTPADRPDSPAESPGTPADRPDTPAESPGTRADRPDSSSPRPPRAFRTPLRGHAFAGPAPLQAVATGRAARLVREPDNPADPFAVAVWVEDDDARPWRIGYLDRTVAARIAPRLDAGAPIAAVIEGWLEEPGGRWQRPLLRVELPADPHTAGGTPRTVHAEVWGRPPGVRRRQVGPGP